MQLIKDTVDFKFQNTAVALGKFDGIHLGHRRILREIARAKEEGYTTVIFTFSVPPASLLKGETESLLLTEEEKISLYGQLGVDVLIIYPVSHKFLATEAESFLGDILCGQLGMKLLIGGEDIHFGRNRRGDAAMAVRMAGKLGYRVKIIRKETVAEILQENGDKEESETVGIDKLLRDDGEMGETSQDETRRKKPENRRKGGSGSISGEEVIGSTRIRECLQKGEIELANRMLGYPYFFTGAIIHGKAVGRTLGFPTINLKTEPCKLLPAYGVYASETVLDGKIYQSITNIGVRPTVSDTMQPSVETYLFDFDRDVYGEKATVRLLRFQRPERKFAGAEELRAQIERDKEERMSCVI
ncbi:MAG: bifunctional riboflavin kinase/FMN adenylyltransferase [Lachnospiraceae bacterium]|nr:bifunctional riboflavin kinase/FMN adenylyltransferase [Lachnospiraceae bacterium]